MRILSAIRQPFQLLTVSIALLAFCPSANAQEQEGDLVYKFNVEGIIDGAAAKAVQYAMMDQGFVNVCNYIEECSCFKMASSVPLTYDGLKNMLIIDGFVLVGPVTVSDGSVIIPSSDALEQR